MADPIFAAKILNAWRIVFTANALILLIELNCFDKNAYLWPGSN